MATSKLLQTCFCKKFLQPNRKKFPKHPELKNISASFYDLNHPKRQNELERNLMCSPFFERQQQLGGHFFQTLGFERAHWYESNRHLLDYNFAKRHFWSAQNWSPIEAVESLQTRNNAAIYDLSAFQVFEVEGSGALDFLQKQVCSNLDVAIGRIVYTQVLTVSGGIKCDETMLLFLEWMRIFFG